MVKGLCGLCGHPEGPCRRVRASSTPGGSACRLWATESPGFHASNMNTHCMSTWAKRGTKQHCSKLAIRTGLPGQSVQDAWAGLALGGGAPGDTGQPHVAYVKICVVHINNMHYSSCPSVGDAHRSFLQNGSFPQACPGPCAQAHVTLGRAPGTVQATCADRLAQGTQVLSGSIRNGACQVPTFGQLCESQRPAPGCALILAAVLPELHVAVGGLNQQF